VIQRRELLTTSDGKLAVGCGRDRLASEKQEVALKDSNYRHLNSGFVTPIVVILALFSVSLRAQDRAGFFWRDPVSGAFTAAGNWDVNLSGLRQNPADPLNFVARIPPRAGDSAFFREGTYTVNMAGAPPMALTIFEQGTAAGTTPVFNVTLQLNGPYDAGDFVMSGAGVITLADGTMKASRLGKSGAQLVLRDALVEFADIPQGATSPPEDRRREVLLIGSSKLTTSGAVNLNGVTVEEGSVWEHTGPAAIGQAPFSRAMPTITVNGGRFRTTALNVEGTEFLIAENGGAFDIGNLTSGNTIRISSGGAMNNQTARIVAALERHAVEGDGSTWKVSRELTITGNAFIDVKDRAQLTVERLLIPQDQAGGHLNAIGNGATITVQQPIEIVSGEVRAENGGLVTAPGVTIRRTSSIQATGTKAVWDSRGDVLDEGEIRVGSGGLIRAPNVQVGNVNPGSVRIFGSSGMLTVEDSLIVGGLNGGAGTINVSEGGGIDADSILIGQGTSASVANIQGVGSTLTNRQQIVVGKDGEGRLFLLTGARAVSGAASPAAQKLHTENETNTLRSRRGNAADGAHAAGDPPPHVGGYESRSPDTEASCIPDDDTGTPEEPKAVIGAEPGAMGFVSLNAATWDVNGKLVIGETGAAGRIAVGTLTIQNGGVVTVNGPYATLGQGANTRGGLVLIGANSKLEGLKQAAGGAGATFEIGRFGEGIVELRNGASMQIPSAILGCFAGSTGVMRVIGTTPGNADAPSNFTSDGSITVGSRSRGFLEVHQGALVKSFGRAVLGRFGGTGTRGRGVVTLRNSGSRWNHTNARGGSTPGDVVVGENGEGQFWLLDGAQFESNGLVIAQEPGSSGLVVASDAGGRLAARSDLVIGQRGTGLDAQAEGTLVITNGAVLAVGGQFVTLGQERFARGILILDGPASRMEGVPPGAGGAGAALEVGRRGEGLVALTNGASLKLHTVMLAAESGAKGSVQVHAGAELEASGLMTVGGVSTGRVEVLNAGRVVSRSDVVLGRGPDAEGAVTLTGPDARWTQVSEGDPNTPGKLIVGDSGRGTVSVVEGADFDAGEIELGREKGTGDPNAIYVTGTDGSASTLTSSGRAVIGGRGTGLVRVQRNASWSLKPSSDVEPTALVISQAEQSDGTIEILGPNASVTWDGTIQIGDESLGKLRVIGTPEGPAILTGRNLELGVGRRGFGDVLVQGDQARVDVQRLSVGERVVSDLNTGPGLGSGTLLIRNGATVNVGSPNPNKLIILGGSGFGLRSDIQVEGGRLLAPNSTIELQGAGESMLAIRNGGRVRSGAGVIGRSSVNGGFDGQASVVLENQNGSGLSRWELIGTAGADDRLIVGETVEGSLKIGSRSLVELIAGRGRIRVGDQMNGSIEVSGEEANLAAPASDMQIGSATRTGSLRVLDGGSVRVQNVNMERLGSLAILDTGGRLRSAGKITLRNNARVEVRQGMLEAGGSGNSAPGTAVLFDSILTSIGQATLEMAGGSTLSIASRLTLSLGSIDVSQGGSIDIGVPPGGTRLPGVVTVGANGELSGHGWIWADAVHIVQNGIAHVHPGPVIYVPVGLNQKQSRTPVAVRAAAAGAATPTATMVIDGNYEQLAGATLVIDVAGPRPLIDFGVLEVLGTAKIAGKLRLNFLQAFAPKRGETFDLLISPAALNGSFEQVEVAGLAPGFEFDVASVEQGTLRLTAKNDGIATSLPKLSIQRSGGELNISWLETVRGFGLQSTFDISNPVWLDRPATGNRLTVPPGNAMEFFRLERTAAQDLPSPGNLRQ
jgi:T5SS/PEP-CTERM-associated repeat protein